MNKMIVFSALIVLSTVGTVAAANPTHGANLPRQLTIPAGAFESVLPPGPRIKWVTLPPFRMDRLPVTNQQFARFVATHPEWRRDRVARVFADHEYLSHWPSATTVNPQQRNQPVVRLSWFAASAYCEARGARLPSWYEWEYVAAASTKARDARKSEEWRQTILTWYSQSARQALPDVEQTSANYYGVHAMHGVIWEWVNDLSAMLVSGDNRQQNDPNELRYCGPGALTMEQKENYATLMRIAMLSSMQASYTSAAMGFRCVTDLGE